MPDVTVVIPTRDRWHVLAERGLRSALAQNGVDLEVVVVDDGSEEPAPPGLAGMDDPRVHVVRRGESHGVAAARNAGIAAARGDWIAFLDDDDLWSPDKLRLQLDAARRHGASVVYAGVVVLDGARNVLYADSPTVASLDELLQRNSIPAGSSNLVVKAELLRAVGGFDERLTYVADWDLWITLAAGGRMAVCPELLVGYVRQGGGMIFTGADAIREMRYFVAKHRAGGLRADPARFLAWIASEDRLAGHRVRAASTYFRSGVAFRKPVHILRAVSTLLNAHVGRWRRRRKGELGAVEPVPDVPWLRLYA
jgi:glycosyltransferase involved in cell wall biosynthesis